jgi:hypothetical protein
MRFEGKLISTCKKMNEQNEYQRGSGAGWLGLALWGLATPHRAHLVAGLPSILGPHAPRV